MAILRFEQEGGRAKRPCQHTNVRSRPGGRGLTVNCSTQRGTAQRRKPITRRAQPNCLFHAHHQADQPPNGGHGQHHQHSGNHTAAENRNRTTIVILTKRRLIVATGSRVLGCGSSLMAVHPRMQHRTRGEHRQRDHQSDRQPGSEAKAPRRLGIDGCDIHAWLAELGDGCSAPEFFQAHSERFI